MDEHWKHKLKRSSNMSNRTINEAYEYAIKNGALGGKLIGAGGGGFLLFYIINLLILEMLSVKILRK